MKRSITLVGISLFLLISFTTLAQRRTKIYTSSGGEIIFSGADMNIEGSEDISQAMRFSPVFNFQSLLNVDPARFLGFFVGLSIRNVGLIYDSPAEPGVRFKHRTYNLAIPIGLKIGRLDKAFIYAGYDIEFPFHYKEKRFVNEDKENKTTIWFSDRVEQVSHSVHVGIQLPYGANIKFKYYLTNFFDKDYVAFVDGVETRPYENFNVNVFYVSLNFNLFHNVKFYYNKGRESYNDDGYSL